MRLLVTVMILGGCGDDAAPSPDATVGQDGPEAEPDAREPVDITLRATNFGAPYDLLFVAFQDGVGSWTGQSGANGVYTFTSQTGRYGVATVCLAGGAPTVEVEWRSTGDETTIARRCDADEGALVPVDGVVTGLFTGETGSVKIGARAANVAAPSGAYTIEARPGKADVIALLSSETESVKMIRIDDATIAEGASFDFDFGGAGFPLERHAATVTGGASGETLQISSALTTVRGTSFTFIDEVDEASWVGVPPAHLRDREAVLVLGGAIAADLDVRTVQRLVRTPADVTLPLGEAIAEPTVTPVTAPYPRLRATVAALEGIESYRLQAVQVGTTWTCSVTTAWLRGATDVEIEDPDFSAVPGWQQAWELDAGVATDWSVIGERDNGETLPAGADGHEVQRSVRVGTITI